MAFLIGYTLGVGLIFTLVLYLIQKKKEITIINKLSFLISIINLVLVTVFTITQIIRPELFSSDYEIKSKIIFALFSLVSMYYYYIILPLSFSFGFMSVYLYKKRNIDTKKIIPFLIINMINIILMFRFMFIIYV